MSFAKAEQLLQLATMLAGRRVGSTLDDVTAEFRVSTRTAQRMLRVLERHFPGVEASFDGDGRKRWRFHGNGLRELLSLAPDELAALDLAIESMTQGGHNAEAAQLRSMRSKILALVPPAKAARLETDHEALLEAQGLLARPGPRPRSDPAIVSVIAEALKACLMLDIDYQALDEPEPRQRRIAPYGVLLGQRRYLVAVLDGAPAHRPTVYRVDRIESARMSNQIFQRPPEFDLRRYASRAFGAFQNEEEYGEVVWRFGTEAADHARDFLFHPEQTAEEQRDGSLLVTFRASGHLEMCWYLYCWGDKVEVLSPKRLREMTHAHRRSDFTAFP